MGFLATRVTRSAVGALIAVAGFACGSVLAEKGLVALSLRNATLYSAVEKVHTTAALNVVFANPTKETRTFDASGGDGRGLLTTVAAPYARKPVSVTGVYVLEDAVPDAMSFSEARTALGGYLARHLPKPKSGKNYSMPLSQQMDQTMRSFQSGLPAGQSSFGSLTPDQQKTALDLIRYSRIMSPMGLLHQGLGPM